MPIAVIRKSILPGVRPAFLLIFLNGAAFLNCLSYTIQPLSKDGKNISLQDAANEPLPPSRSVRIQFVKRFKPNTMNIIGESNSNMEYQNARNIDQYLKKMIIKGGNFRPEHESRDRIVISQQLGRSGYDAEEDLSSILAYVVTLGILPLRRKFYEQIEIYACRDKKILGKFVFPYARVESVSVYPFRLICLFERRHASSAGDFAPQTVLARMEPLLIKRMRLANGLFQEADERKLKGVKREKKTRKPYYSIFNSGKGCPVADSHLGPN